MLAKQEIDYMAEDFDPTATIIPEAKADDPKGHPKGQGRVFKETLDLLRDSVNLLRQAHLNLMCCVRTGCPNRIPCAKQHTKGGNV